MEPMRNPRVYPFRRKKADVAYTQSFFVNVHRYADSWNSEIVVDTTPNASPGIEEAVVKAILDYYRALPDGGE